MRALIAGLGAALVVVAGLGCGDGAHTTPDDAGVDARQDDAAEGVDSGTHVTIQTFVDDHQQDIRLVAYRDGDGPWRTLTGSDGSYGFVTKTGRYSIARSCATVGWLLLVEHATVADATHFEFPCLESGPPDKDATLQGTVGGLASGEEASLFVAGPSLSILGHAAAAQPVYSLKVPHGPHELLAVRSAAGVPLQVARHDSIEIAATATATCDVDFAAEGVDLLKRAITVAGVEAGEEVSGSAALHLWVGGKHTQLPWLLDASSVASVVPVSLLQGSDLHAFEASVTGPGGAYQRGARLYVRDAQDTTLEPPPPPTAPLVWVSRASPVLVSARFDLPDWADGVGLTLAQDYRSIAIGATRAWLDGANEIEIPDLSEVASQSEAWCLWVGQSVDWNVWLEFSADGPELPSRWPHLRDGLVQKRARFSGSLIP